jgi:hypothetical protein
MDALMGFSVVLILAVLVLALWIFRISERVRELDRLVLRLTQELTAPQSVKKQPVSQSVPAAPVVAPSPPSSPVAETIVRVVAEQPKPPKPPTVIPSVDPAPPSPPTPRLPVPPRVAVPQFDWEQFMGVKGFAWIGGLALFLGIAFFVKYSFDNNLIPPELRVVIGFLSGLGLLVGGTLLSRERYATLSQTLSATGVVALYAVTYSCRALYHFEFFGPVPTFLLMALITATAFLLAVRRDALVVAILGMLAGFLTPVLLSTGQDNPIGLFGYIAILDAGLILVAMSRRWDFLSALAALGTAVMQIGWVARFFVVERYFDGDKILVALGVLAGFNALYFGANWISHRRNISNRWLLGSQLALTGLAFLFTLFFLTFQAIAGRPILMFTFVFLIDLGIALLAWLNDEAVPAQPISGLLVFGLLAVWSAQWLNNEMLNAALAFYFVFAVFHTALPEFVKCRNGSNADSQKWNHLFPSLALLLVLAPIFTLKELSFVVWPFVLLVDILAIGLAVVTAELLPVLAVLALTVAATGVLIFKIPPDLTGLPTSFFLLGAFAVFFVVATVWLVSKFMPKALERGLRMTDNVTSPESIVTMLPVSSVVLPFLLLIMATLKLPLKDPSPVFGLALLLVVLLLGVTRIFTLDWMPVIGLASTFALECAWSFNHFDPANPNVPLAWYLVFFAVFALYPFCFLRRFSMVPITWVAAALAGPLQFVLVYRLVKAVWPNSFMGLLPAVFALPALVSLVVVLRKIPADSKARMAQLAWFGGVTLLFVTLIFPIQFDRQWITIGWALEGAALCWLFHRVPHPGLRLTGVALLVAAFCRLALNPAVFAYHPRSATPIFNWYLYTYALVVIALLIGARLLAPPRNIYIGDAISAQGALASLGTVLTFLLLNIEIADYFSEPGSTLTFQFSGNFGRDMTYSIAWGLFALGLLVYGILKEIKGARYAAMGLLSVTLLKLFVHDLAQLGQAYRIAAFIIVAVIAMLASFLYQRFFSATNKEVRISDEPRT